MANNLSDNPSNVNDNDQVIVNDSTDAVGGLFNNWFSHSVQPTVRPPKPQSIAADEENYDTSHPKAGIALIFNHFKFSNQKFSPRNGTNKDRDDIAHILSKYHFDVRIFNDLKYVQLIDELARASKEDHTNHDCIVIVVMSHGDEGVIQAYDVEYRVNELWDNFIGNNCRSLIGKPKMVFIQACRGNKIDPGSTYETERKGEQFDRPDSVKLPKRMTYYIPQMADLLVMYSTFEGHVSWRDTDGSWFIQALCAELQQNGQKYELLRLLTGVVRRVAYTYQSNVPDAYHLDCMKQMPCITSMLTKSFSFKNQLK